MILLRNKKRIMFFTMIGFFLVSFNCYLLSDKIFDVAHQFLTVRDPMEKADVIVVLGGGFGGERLEEGIRLFKGGYASKIVLSGGLITKDISTADLELKRLLDTGISKELIYSNREATSTYDNAVNSADIMKKNDMKKAIVVTSPYHTRRARWIFRKIFDKNGLKVIVVPVTQNDNLNVMLKTDYMFEDIVFEYQKLIMYWLRY